jgi:hypothetical protein
MRLHIIGVCVVLLAAAVSAQAPPSVSNEVAGAHADWNAAGQRGDKAAYARYLADNLLWINESGGISQKSSLVDQLRPAAAGAQATTSTPGVQVYPGGAVLSATRRNANGSEVRLLQAWVRQGTQWQIVLHHALAVGDAAPAVTAAQGALPPNAGSAADLKAIDDAIAALQAATVAGDGNTFGTLVTDQFIYFVGGNMGNKSDRINIINSGRGAGRGAGGGGQDSGNQELSTRIVGTMAVTTMRTAQNVQSIVHVKDQGKWLRAAIMATPIVAAAAR